MNIVNIDKYETTIICVFIVTVTSAVVTKSIDQSTYAALMGAFVGYTFGRIFNHVQGKE